MHDLRRGWRGWLAVLGWWASGSAVLGGSFVEHLAPTALTRGRTTRVTLVGAELNAAIALWTSLDPGALEATLVEPSTDGQATFDVTVRPDAPLGLYGLRLASRSGLSNVRLFLIDDLPTVLERERSTTTAPPQVLNGPVAVLGTASEADLDRYAIAVAAGQRVSFEVVGNRLGQDLDPVVTIKDARGRRVVERDNDVGLMFDTRFAHTFEKAGTYTIEVRDTRFRGSEHTRYVLRVGRFPEGRVALPSSLRPGDDVNLIVPGETAFTQHLAAPKRKTLGGYFQELRRPDDQASAWAPLQVATLANTLEVEPNDAPETATRAEVPRVLHGAVASPDDRDAFAFDLQAGQRVSLRVECRALGSPADLDVSLIDPAGKPLNRLDTLPDGAASFEVQAKSKGRHVLMLRSLTGEGGPEYVYRITLAPREPAVELVSEANGLAVPRGSYQPLPLSLKRTDVNGPVALALEGAPAGMSLRTETFREGETELDNAIVVGETVPEGLYSVRVVGRAKAEGGERSAVATTSPLVDRPPTGHGPHGEPFELREDQRRLPPSLTDRVAVLVTAPSPFTFELPDSSVVLPRYLDATFPLETTRAAGFDAPITFVARGGTLEPLMLQKPRVKADMPPATRDAPTSIGVLRSGVNSEIRKHRVTVTAHAVHDGRAIDLTRTFELRVQPAYAPAAEPARVEVAAGATSTTKVRARRIPPFLGPISIRPIGPPGWGLPEALEIADGSEAASLEWKVPAGTKPGVYRVALAATARVAKFDEAVAGTPIEVVVTAPKPGGTP